MKAPVLFTVPRDSEPATCRGCGAAIYWIRTRRGKLMPVDTRGAGGLEPMRDRDGHGVSHFATCPKADHYRMKKPAPLGDGRATP